MWQSELAKLVDQQFKYHKRINPKYSIRAYAKKLGLSPGSLSDLLLERKTWNISPKLASAVLDKLSLKPSVRNRLLVKMGEQPKHEIKEINLTDYDILVDWTYQPVLAAFDLPEEQRDAKKIAERLGLNRSKVDAVIADLIKRGLLERSQDGEIRRPEVFMRTSDGIPNKIMLKHHEINLQLSLKALRALETEKRDFTSLTFVGGQQQMDFLRREIRKLYEKASSLMDAESQNDSIFRLSVQLFPVEFKRD